MVSSAISGLVCNECGYSGNYPEAGYFHEHPELEIGGVPMNIWKPVYSKEKAVGLSGLIRAPLAKGISDGEGGTPLLKVEGIGGERGISVYVKDEGENPTGSFKDRGMPYLVTDAMLSGKGSVAIPSTGNAAVSLAKYARRGGIKSIVFVPKGTEKAKIDALSADEIILKPDLIAAYEDFFRFCRERPDVYNGFPASNIPYLEGLKSSAYEIFESLGNAPDWLVVPCGSGGNVLALARGFSDLKEAGKTDRLPRICPVQIAGADPITKGSLLGERKRAIIIDPMAESRAEAIASDTCFNYRLIMDALEASGGVPISVTDREIEAEIERDLPKQFEFSSMAAYSAGRKVAEKLASPGETVVLIGTGKRRD